MNDANGAIPTRTTSLPFGKYTLTSREALCPHCGRWISFAKGKDALVVHGHSDPKKMFCKGSEMPVPNKPAEHLAK